MMNLSQLSETNPLLALKMQAVEPASEPWSDWEYSLEGIDVLFAYGAGDGSLYDKVKPWLKERKERRLIWIAVDEGDAWGFEGLEDTQVVHLTMAEEQVLKAAVWKTVLLNAGWAEPLGVKAPKEEVETLRAGVQLLLFKARDFGKKELFNVLENFGNKCLAPFGQLKGLPAIVCGSGPSLDPSELKAYCDKAYIFAGGSALGKLGFDPHFGAGCDPDPKKLKTQVPFFYTDRFSASALKEVSGPRLWVRGADELPLETWILDQLGLDVPKIDLGWSVGCMVAAIAAEMGCDPIVFYGMDLTDENDPIEVVDKWGQKTRSRQDLIMSAKWLAELITRYPDRTWIDASPCGLEIKGAKKQTLPELVQQDLKPLKNETHQVEVGLLKQKITKSLDACKKLCIENTPAAMYELECEVFYQQHLKPLWQLWKPLLLQEGEEKMQALLFYQRVLKAYD